MRNMPKRLLGWYFSGAIKAEEYNAADPSGVKEIYEYVMTRSSLSLSEVDGIVEELGQLT